jgi:CubicO group peptidase (beta-lactamase class C family)
MLLFFSFLFFFLINNVNPGKPSAEYENIIQDLVKSFINKKKSSKIDAFFQNKYKHKQFNGTVLYAEKGRTIYKGAFGYSDFKKKDTLTTNSAFQLASVSKPLTAFAIMILVENKIISLTDSIENFFPDFPYKKITIEMLLTHRSGLPNYLYFSDYLWPDPKSPISNQDVIELMIKHKPPRYFRPNKKFNYSNTNYCILAAIIEKVSGMSFEKFMEKQIFLPLEMTSTFIYKKGLNFDIPKKVVGYNRYGKIADNTYLNGVAGDKGVYSSVEDLLKWDRALYLGELLNRTSIEKFYQPPLSKGKTQFQYGLGWRISTNQNKHKIAYHSGWWKGFKSHYLRDLDSDKVIIVLMNSVSRNRIYLNDLKELL